MAFRNGVWAFEDLSIPLMTARIGSFDGWVDIDDGQIDAIHVKTDDGAYLELAPDSWLFSVLRQAVTPELSDMIEHQSSSPRHWRESIQFQRASRMRRAA